MNKEKSDLNELKKFNEIQYLTDEELIEKMKIEAMYSFRDSEDYYDDKGNFIIKQ